MKLHVTLLALLLAAGPALAQSGSSVDDAVKRLAASQMFAFGGVGYAGTTSQGEIDFRFLAAQPRPVALAAFERLYAIANPQGKAYALAGIKKLRPSRFEELLASTAASTESVEVARGCVLSHEPLPEVARQIGDGRFASPR